MVCGIMGLSIGKEPSCVCGVVFFSSRRRHTRFDCDWSSVCSSDLLVVLGQASVAGAAPSNQAHFGNQVTFNIKSSTSEPWVGVTCSQNGQNVYGQYWGFWEGYSVSQITSTMAVGGVFTLGPTALWSSGTASCTASLFTYSKSGRRSTL